MDLRPTFEHYFPDGSKGGECGIFAHNLVTFPLVGDTIITKKAAVKKSGFVGNYQAGDVLILDVGTKAGHVGILNDDSLFSLTESNWKLDGRVHHNRTIPRNSKQIVGAFRGPLKLKLMTTLNISIVSTSPWPDIDKFMSMAKDWSGGRLVINLVNQVSPNLPPIQLEDVLGFKQPEHQWLIDNVFQYRKDADAIILNIIPIGLNGENGYCKAPATPSEAFTLFLACGDLPIFTQTYGYSNSTKLTLHELSHMLYLITGGVDQTHPADLTPGHSLIEAYQQLDYERLATNLALRRQQKLMPQIKTQAKGASRRIILEAADLTEWQSLCKVFGKDATKVEETVN